MRASREGSDSSCRCDAMRCAGSGVPESPTTWAAIKTASGGKSIAVEERLRLNAVGFGRLGWPWVAWDGQKVAVGAGRKKRERAVEEEAEEKGRPGTVNTPTDALRNVSCRATQGREGQERGEEGEE